MLIRVDTYSKKNHCSFNFFSNQKPIAHHQKITLLFLAKLLDTKITDINTDIKIKYQKKAVSNGYQQLLIDIKNVFKIKLLSMFISVNIHLIACKEQIFQIILKKVIPDINRQ